ncbi:hypothetical protein [Vibrio natriegens]|uniref:hypothetical protein n=1 Tax=Vibrio natriegens TaxID=691 RepID=UPI001FB8C03B|nr:hypothetical protein [Vibrio natriegens]
MAKELLVRDYLSPQMINSGGKLIKKLDEQNAEVKSALWFFMPETRTWTLLIASPLVSENGPKQFYKKIIDANRKSKLSERVISINNISATSPSDPLIQIINTMINTDKEAINGIRFSRNTINGVFIEDCHIYRSSR